MCVCVCVNGRECQAVPQYLFGIVSLLYWWHQPIDPISGAASSGFIASVSRPAKLLRTSVKITQTAHS